MSLLRGFGIETGLGRFYEEGVYSLVLLYNKLTVKITQYLKPFELSPGKFNILMIVKHQGAEEGISQVDVSKRLLVTPANMTKLITKLEAVKLISREASAQDRRFNVVKITDKGSRLLDQIWPGYDAILRDFYQVNSHADQKKMAEMLIHWAVKVA